MKILIVSQYFYPENFRINDLALELKNRGHSITVLTGIPNYPGGKFYNGYGYFKKNIEYYKEIKIYRSPIYPRGEASNWRLALNYLSFVLGSIITSFFLLKKDFDVIFVFEPSPITVCLPAIFIKKVKKIPICFWVLDLWPESVISAGNLKSNLIPKLIDPIVKFIYKNSDRILVSSEGFVASIKEKGISENKIHFFPQWAESIFKPQGKPKKNIGQIPRNSFIIMFAGNIGEAQDFPSILKAARVLKFNKKIHWVIIGSGRKETWVKQKIKEYKITNCFHMLGRHPIEEMPKFYAYADCMLFSLKNEYIFSITIPAKVQSYLACGKPIIGMINGEAAELIKNSKSGLVSPSEDYNLLVENIKKISSLNKKDLEKIGLNALQCYQKNFERSMLIDRLENFFKVLKKI